MTADDRRARLIAIIRDRSYGTGVTITLASGRTSDFYFNLKPTMLHPEGADLIGDLMADVAIDQGADAIGGLEMGAVPIATVSAAASFRKQRPVPAFFVRKATKAHGTQSLIEGFAPGESIAGRQVLIVEDVTTTGGSALKACDVVKAAGAELLGVATVVDREEGAGDEFAAASVPFFPLLTRSDFL